MTRPGRILPHLDAGQRWFLGLVQDLVIRRPPMELCVLPSRYLRAPGMVVRLRTAVDGV